MKRIFTFTKLNSEHSAFVSQQAATEVASTWSSPFKLLPWELSSALSCQDSELCLWASVLSSLCPWQLPRCGLRKQPPCFFIPLSSGKRTFHFRIGGETYSSSWMFLCKHTHMQAHVYTGTTLFIIKVCLHFKATDAHLNVVIFLSF